MNKKHLEILIATFKHNPSLILFVLYRSEHLNEHKHGLTFFSLERTVAGFVPVLELQRSARRLHHVRPGRSLWRVDDAEPEAFHRHLQKSSPERTG